MRILHQTNQSGSVSQRLGPYEIEALIPPGDEGAMTAYRVRIEPGQTTATSFHRIAEELYYVLAGSGTAVLNGEPHPLKTGDFLRLPPGVKHCFTTGTEALVMLDIHAPGSRPDRDVYFVGDVPPGFGENQ